ncbi:MAG: SpoIIE family protein phosphatase [Caldilineaceae bacterium]|nr:SpoIIE family protein phosphatase [Caldilineaceae bacterium]MBP8107068.1 SpoIIE family protein phosphatase [Caldilineaceae bacterium]MBP8121106.1 SpoIIE family protein phosphatase [Caldilineaceae bacterium]MBP9070777.1 SpoIIE family protein phosphatase [Caldilineaceae bacterium]
MQIDALVASQKKHLKKLADAWMAAGASGFGISDMQTVVTAWPPCPGAATASLVPSLDTPLQNMMDETIGTLWVTGVDSPADLARLQAQADLITHLFVMEGELMDMTMELVHSQDLLVALFDLTQSMRSQLRMDEAMKRVVAEARRLVGTEAAFMVFAQPDQEILVVQEAGTPLDSDCLIGLHEQAKSAGEELHLQAPDMPACLVPRVSTVFLVPIEVRGEQMAVLGLVNKTSGRFDAPDQKLARAIANQVGAQLENVLLYQETLAQTRMQTEMELAKSVQLRLLPQRSPKLAGLELVASSQPALEVGGDFFDYIHEKGRLLTCMVGDVSGKGMPAAMLMAMTLTAFRGKTHTVEDASPAARFSRTNEALYNDFTEVGMFATVFVGQYDPAQRCLRFVNAGHSPVIYRPAGGAATMLEADGVPVGVLPVSLCEQQEVSLGPGDLLILGTDGFSEAANRSGEMFGYDRLLELTDQLAGQSAQEIHDQIYLRIRQFAAGHPQDDDQTLMVLKGTK